MNATMNPLDNGRATHAVLTLELLDWCSSAWVRLPMLSERAQLEGVEPETLEMVEAVRGHLEACRVIQDHGRVCVEASCGSLHALPDWPDTLISYRGIYVKVRTVRRADYAAFLPPRPLGAESWAQEPGEYAAAYQRWIDALPTEDRQRRQREEVQVTYLVVRAGLIFPVLSESEIERLASDADHVAQAIMRLSGLLPAVIVP